MSQNLVSLQPAWNAEQVALVKRTICKDASDDELKLFMHIANKSGLDPFARQIYATKRVNHKTGEKTMVVQTSIDGFRLIASRTDAYAGSDDPVFDNEESPTKATVTIYKMVQGQRCAFTATARWKEYCPPAGQDFMWKKMPCVMLAKVAEALALRKAFPADLSGIYAKEEMDQAEADNGRVSPGQPGPEDGHAPIDGEWRFPGGANRHRKFSELSPADHKDYIQRCEAYFQKIKKPLPAWWDEYLALAEPAIAALENGTQEG